MVGVLVTTFQSVKRMQSCTGKGALSPEKYFKQCLILEMLL